MGFLLKIALLAVIIVMMSLVLSYVGAMLLLPPPRASASLDSTLAAYQHFRKLGIEVTPVIGNLEMTGETYAESNHIWLMVKCGGVEIAYDRGTPRFDRQHYESYPVSPEQLLETARDKQKDDHAPNRG